MIEMVKKQVNCGRCKRLFWSPVTKAYILIAKKKKGKEEVRIVKGAFMKRAKAEEERTKLEKELCPKEYDKIDIEPQLTIKKFLCQRCQNVMSMMQNRAKHRKAVMKQITKNRPVREIPKEEVNKYINYQIQQKIVQDYRKKQQEEASEKRKQEVKRRQLELKKIQAEKKALTKVKAMLEKKDAKKNGEAKKPVGEDKRKTA